MMSLMNTTQRHCIYCESPIGIHGTSLAPIGGKCDACILRGGNSYDNEFVTFVDLGGPRMIDANIVDTSGDL
jgi:hypothetical protein